MFERFHSNILTILPKLIGNFQWCSASSYIIDKTTNDIFFATSCLSQDRDEFPKNSKGSLLPRTMTTYYDLNSTQLNPQDFKEYSQLQTALMKRNIEEETVGYPNNADIDLHNEVLDCKQFVAYVLTQSLKEMSENFVYGNVFNKMYHLMKMKYYLIDEVPKIDYDTSIQVGDLLFFVLPERLDANGDRKPGHCLHVGFFWGYNDQHEPLICDLWNRDNSNSVKVVNFANCIEYTRHNFTIRHLPLQKLFAEISQVITLTANVTKQNESSTAASVVPQSLFPPPTPALDPNEQNLNSAPNPNTDLSDASIATNLSKKRKD